MPWSPSGTYRHLVTLENPGGSVPDGDGGWTEAYAPLVPPQVWASITPATAADLERAANGTVLSSASHIVRMAYHAGVTTKTRLTFNSRVFSVTGIANPEERNRELILACEERLGE